MLGDDDDLFFSFFLFLNKLMPNMKMIDFGSVLLILSTNTHAHTYTRFTHIFSLSLRFFTSLHFTSLRWRNGIHLLLPVGESILFFFLQCIYIYVITRYRSQIPDTYIHTKLLFFYSLLKRLLHMTMIMTMMDDDDYFFVSFLEPGLIALHFVV